MSNIIVNGKQRDIDMGILYNLSKTCLPEWMNDQLKKKFANEVAFRISDLEFDGIDITNKSIEEYYFKACLIYSEYNGFINFINEEDDCNIFDYCGSEFV